jgi:hypothetical protein
MSEDQQVAETRGVEVYVLQGTVPAVEVPVDLIRSQSLQ